MPIIYHGSSGFGYATINTSGASPTFDAPVALPGMTGMSIEIEESAKKIYADNALAVILDGASTVTAKATVHSLPETFVMAALGKKRAANGMVTDTGDKKSMCVFFIQDTVDTATLAKGKVLHYLYDVKAKHPTVEAETDSDEMTESSLEIEFEAKPSTFVKDEDGASVTYASITRTTENAELFDSFMDAVITPETPVVP